MKNILTEAKKINISIDENLAKVDVTKVAPKKLEEANRYALKVRLPLEK
jgi:hypothetical protein